MSRMKNKESGDYAPSFAPFVPVGRFKIISVLDRDRLWVMDTETGEAGSFDADKLEAALIDFWRKEF